MKFDMGGSAATLGAAKAIGLIKPPGVEASFPLFIFFLHSERLHWKRYNMVRDSK